MADDLSIRNKCETFSDNTSLHGLKHAGGSGSKLYRRAVWLVLMLLMLSLLLFYLITRLMRYFDYPTTTKMNLFENTTLVFPAITICNNNLVHIDYMEKHPLVSNVTGPYVPVMKLPPTMNLSDPAVIAQMQGISYVSIFTEGGHQLQELFELCSWKGQNINCSESFIPVLTDNYGQCYTFNADGAMTISSPGIYSGLDVVLDIEQDQYSHYGSSAGAGIKVLTHEPNSVPVFQTKALSIAPGVLSELRIYREEEIYLPSPYEGPDCYKGDEYTSLMDCKLKCNVDYLLSECGCQALPYLDREYHNCSLYEYTQCIYPASTEYWTDKRHEESCECRHYCNEVNYNVKQSQMLFPSNYAAVYYNDNFKLNIDADTFRDSMVYLRIYYDSMLTTTTEQVASYTFANFFAEVGGYMGLFLGASLLTLTELLEFLLSLIKSCCKKRNKSTKTHTTHNEKKMYPQ